MLKEYFFFFFHCITGRINILNYIQSNNSCSTFRVKLCDPWRKFYEYFILEHIIKYYDSGERYGVLPLKSGKLHFVFFVIIQVLQNSWLTSILVDNSDIYVIFQSAVTKYAESSPDKLSYIMRESVNFSYSRLIE